MYPALFSIISLTIIGCSTGPKEMNVERATQVVKFGDHFFASIKGKPISEEVKPTENPHVEGQMDEWRTIKYEGFTATYYRVVPEKRNILRTLEINSDKVQLPFGLHIGVTKSAVLSSLGKPTSSDRGLLIYECGDPYSQTVCFTIARGVVSEITWENEID